LGIVLGPTLVSDHEACRKIKNMHRHPRKKEKKREKRHPNDVTLVNGHSAVEDQCIQCMRLLCISMLAVSRDVGKCIQLDYTISDCFSSGQQCKA
jgi:hypothetical protein